ncbi:MAG: glycosyltransferase family 2 protein [Eubacteriales bacterium]
MNIKVSIVLPVYNMEKYLHQCLVSLCCQTLKEIEIICVDDGSKDNSMAILEVYAGKDERIKIFENKEEGPGAAHARNLGVSQATGEYLLVLDSDDYFHEELAEKTYQRAIETEAEIVLFDAMEVDDVTGEPNPFRNSIHFGLLPDKKVFSPMEFREDIYQVTNGSAWTKLYKTSFVRENSLKFQPINVMDDIFFTFSSYSIAKKISYIEDKLVYYRVNNSNSQTRNMQRDPLSPLKFAQELKEFLAEKGLLDTYSKSFIRTAHQHFRWYFRQLDCYADFSVLYDALHKNGIAQLFSGLTTDTQQDLSWANEIMGLSCPEYMFQCFHNVEKHFCKFPKELQNKELKVILYGGGLCGKSLFAQNSFHHYCSIVGWVDRNYEKIGFPLTGVESLTTTEYNCIFITLESLEECEKIKKSLFEMGISPEKILYRDTL